MIRLVIPVFLMAGIIKGQEPSKLVPVNHVDLNKYTGLWYEIAKIPNSFQKNCAKNTTAEYTIRYDGKINVVNTCTESDGKKNTAEGIARIVDTNSNAKLEVSFVRFLGINFFWGDYWIIGLGDNYEYAIVGNPSRKYGWILSRTPKLAPEKLDQINNILKIKGYDPTKFEFTLQD